jgi:hypothetical protein
MRQISIAVFTFFITASSVNASIDYCWKESYGRGVGTIPTTCSSGQETQGEAPFFTCYEKCTEGYDSTIFGGCMQSCPANTKRDRFGNCVDDGVKKRYKYEEYTVVRNPDKCNIFMSGGIEACFWRSCRSDHGQDGCKKVGAAIVAKCAVGYTEAALHCIPDLDCDDYVGKGVDAYGKTFCETKRLAPRAPQPADCGSDKVNDAGLCYKTCGANSNGVGPVCWVSCPKGWLDCGAGCSKDAGACASNTADMVLSVLDSAVSIATIGTASPIKAVQAAKKATGGIRKAAIAGGKKFATEFVGGYKNLAEGGGKAAMAVVGLAQDANTIQSTTRGVINFASAVQDIVGKNISQEEMDFQIAQQVLGYASLLDPSGVVGVVAAYTKPICNVVRNGSIALAEANKPVGAAANIIAHPQAAIAAMNAQLTELKNEQKTTKDNRRKATVTTLIIEKEVAKQKLTNYKPKAQLKTVPIPKTGSTVQSKSVTAAMTLATNKATYLFYSDGTYSRTSASRSSGLDSGYPQQLPGGWAGIPTNWLDSINAALPYQSTSKGYMWRDGQYLRLNNVTKDSGYPSNMPGDWVNMPATWGGNVDAAIHYQPNNRHYFFKGNEYVRLTGTKVDAGYPAKLPGGWQGMPADFASGIDAATFRNGHVYMIKGSQYIRFTGTKVDAGYPKPMSNWPQ